MANSIKKKSANIVVWMILLLLVVGLGGFGVTNFGSSRASVATVGDVEIDVNDYYRALQQELRSFQAQTGQPISLQQAISLGLDRKVLGQLVTGAAFENETARIGLSVGDERVKSEIVSNPAFRGLSGSFDREAYKQSLRQRGLTESEYEEKVRSETARSILLAAVQNGVAAPTPMRDAFLDFIRQQRNFSWIKLDANALSEPVPEPTDEQLQAYYDANKADFTEPEKKRLDYIWVTPAMIVDKIDIPEEDLQAEYKSRADQYSKPERRLVERLIFPDQDAAKAAKAKLDAGETTFEDLVKERGLTLLDIDLGDVTRDALGKAADAVFAMTGPGVVGPLETDLGPALFRMNGILPAQETSFEDVRQQLQDELALDRARRQIAASITDIDDLLAGGASLKEVADETDMKLGRIDWAEGDSDGIAGYNAFREAAAAVQEGDYAEAKELEDGGLFALEFVETVPPTLKPLDQVMPDVISGWENAEIEKRLTRLADDLLARLDKGEDIAALGYPVNTEQEILRDATIEGIPFGLIGEVFDMDKGETRNIDGNGVVYLVRLDDILPPDPENPDLAQARDNLQAAISQSLSQDVFSAFNGALQTQAGVYVNNAAVNAVHAQFPQ